MYLLDTNACIRVLNGSSQAVVNRMRAADPGEVRLCSVVKAELLHGARHSARAAANLEHLKAFCAPYICLPFDDLCAESYAIIRAELSAARRLIGFNDLLIAATARAYDLTLVSHNVREFSRVSGFRVEDWE